MNTQSEYHRLLIAIKALYSKVTLRALHVRMHSNSKTFKSNHHQYITEKLNRHIERLANFEEQMTKDIGATPDSIKHIKTSENADTGHDNKKISLVIYDGLSKFFKINKTHDEQQSYVGDKLKNSTWTHIHAALRMTRQGDKSSAKLHADIANSALKEASHFMSVEEYKVFCEQVMDALSEIKC